jgi:hypothetical protein
MFAIECGEVEGLKMPVRVRTFEDAGIRTPRRGLVVGDAGGREFRLSIAKSDRAASEGIRDWFLGPICAVWPRSLPILRR